MGAGEDARDPLADHLAGVVAVPARDLTDRVQDLALLLLGGLVPFIHLCGQDCPALSQLHPLTVNPCGHFEMSQRSTPRGHLG